MAHGTVPLALTTAEAQPEAAEVVIIGGGVIGTSVAWHLASAGVDNIVVVDQAELGAGSSAKPLGGVRANFSDSGNIALGRRSLVAFERFGEDFGVDIGLQQVGYLFLARTQAELEDLERAAEVQHTMEVKSRLLSPRETAELNPFLDPAALLGASYSPRDGYAQPARVVETYTAAAAEQGVTVLNRTQVMDIERTGSTITAVETNRGRISTPAVICCAGAWSAKVGAMAGVDLPVVPVRRMIGMTAQQDQPHPTIPFTLDLGTTMYFHNCGSGLLLGVSHVEEDGFCRDYSYDWLREFKAAAAVCAPSLAAPELAEGWAGYYENTPDRNALIGRSEQTHGFLYATGFSGHGFLQAPAVGELMADLYVGRPSFMDPAPFSAERFRGAASARRERTII